jgi:hypothetical protein
MCLMIALTISLPSSSQAAQVVQYGDATQDNDYTEVFIDFINNDMGTTYDSATMDIDALLGSVADHIIAHNSDYSSSTRSNIYSRIFFMPRGPPEGDVANGWYTAKSENILSFFRLGLEPDVWAYGLKMRMFIDFPSSLFDYNHDGVPDVTFGKSSSPSNLALNAFTGITDSGTPRTTSAYSYFVSTPTSGWVFTSNIINAVTNLTITGYSGSSSFLIFPDSINSLPVTAISEGAFSSVSSLVGVSIPSSIADIGRLAFANCLGLSSLTFENGVTNIGDLAFYACTNLTTVTIPASLSHLGMAAFVNISSLNSFSVSTSNQCFSSSNGILFDKSQTTLLQFPAAKTNDLSIPPTVVNLGDFAFSGCLSLKDISIPNGVTNIGFDAFYYCNNLTNAVIPASVVNIGSNAFSWSTRLTNIVFKGNPPAISLPIFDWDDALTVYYYPWTSGWGSTFGGRPTQVIPAYTQWLLNYGLATNRTEDATDRDGDKMLNWQEYLAGTCPTNKDDTLAITSIEGTNSSQIAWMGKSNVSYQVMKSLDLMVAWSNAPSGIWTNQQSLQTATVDGILQYTDPEYEGMTNAFYRVNLVP